MQGFQILANGNERRAEFLRQVAHQNTAIAVQHFQYSSPPLLIQHAIAPSVGFVLFPLTLSDFQAKVHNPAFIAKAASPTHAMRGSKKITAHCLLTKTYHGSR